MSRVLILANNDVGLYKFRREFIEELLRSKEVYTALPNGSYIGELEKLGCIYKPVEFNSGGTNPFHDLKLFVQYLKLMRRVKPSLVLAYTIKPCIYGGIVSRILKIPYIVSVTGITPAIASRTGLVRAVTVQLCKIGFKNAHCVFYQNTMNAELFERLGIFGKKRVLTNGSGVNTARHKLEKYPDDESTITFAFVGRLIKVKGIEEYSAAIKNLRKKYSNLRFVFAGQKIEEDMPTFWELYRNDKIEWVGEIDDVHSFIKGCHALVMPSYAEGMSNVMLEAASCGRPVLASKVPGCAEIFDDGVSGIGFEPRSAAAIERAIEQFLALSHKERAEMGLAGRRIVEDKFERSAVIREYMLQVDDVLKRKA